MPGYSRSEEFSSRGVNLSIRGDEEVFSNETNTYEVTVGGTFGAEAENWTLNSRVLEGFATVSPESQESDTDRVFEVEMTATQPGTVIIEFEVFCTFENETRRDVETREIDVVEPTKISVLVTNPTDSKIEDIKVGLFVNGELKRTIRIRQLDPDGQRRIQFNWSKENLEPGEHKLEIWVDYGMDSEEEFNKEELLLERSFYISDDNGYTLYTALIVLLVVGVIGAFFFYHQKKKKRRRPW